MSDVKISALPAGTPNAAATLPAVQGGVTVKLGMTAIGATVVEAAAATDAQQAIGVQFSNLWVTVDGQGSVPTTGSKGYLEVPFACTIVGATMVSDRTGSAVIDVKKSDYAGFPTNASICAAAKPTLTAARKSQDLTLTGWTTALAKGDILEFNLDSAATLYRVMLSLQVVRA